MLITVLLMFIYLAFISMGLPDSLLGSTWPAMYGQMGVPISYAGVLSMIISAGTIVSSFFSDRLLRRFGTGVLTAGSVCLTAAALLGFSYGTHFAVFCLWAVPLGLGAGSVDAALNNFVALHYEAKHMNWLHCFWGIGATAGPVLLSFWLAHGYTWVMGYRTVGFVQLGLGVILFGILPLWKRVEQASGEGKEAVVESCAEKTEQPVSSAQFVEAARCLCGTGCLFLLLWCGNDAGTLEQQLSGTLQRGLCGSSSRAGLPVLCGDHGRAADRRFLKRSF